jgi:hypothetical protein
VADYKEYRVYSSGFIPGDRPRCLLLLQVDGGGHAGEGFHLSLEGDRLEADVWSSDLFTAPELSGFRLRYEMKVGSVELRPNTFSSRWEDVIALLGRGALVAFRPDAAEDCSAEFKQLYAAELKANPSLGAALRWAIQAKDKRNLRLLLQALPTTADRLRAEPRLSADEGQAMHLEALEVEADMLEEDDGPGLVPILFARDPPEVRDILAKFPNRIKTGELLGDADAYTDYQEGT